MSTTQKAPWASPLDWRDVGWMYLIVLDRFCGERPPAAGAWNVASAGRQGGTFRGAAECVGYVSRLGAGALRLTPVGRAPSYHGYDAPDAAAVDERLASDGTHEGAERELRALVDAAHAANMFVVLDATALNNGVRRCGQSAPAPDDSEVAAITAAHRSLVARFDFDGLRVDPVSKSCGCVYHRGVAREFASRMRNWAASELAKRNFLTLGEPEIATPLLRSPAAAASTPGTDAAFDFPLFFALAPVCKRTTGGNVERLREVYRPRDPQALMVSFLDNADLGERFRHQKTPQDQVTLGLTLLFALSGLPCVLYGTEQDLSGVVNAAGQPAPVQYEGVREALWGKPDAFSEEGATWKLISELSRMRSSEAALRCGAQYFRPVSAGGSEGFGLPLGVGGVVAFSRILAGREVVVVANTGDGVWFGHVLVDRSLNQDGSLLHVWSNRGASGTRTVSHHQSLTFWERGVVQGRAPGAVIRLQLRPSEAMILTPAQK